MIHVTLTDDHPWAQAFVVIEARPLRRLTPLRARALTPAAGPRACSARTSARQAGHHGESDKTDGGIVETIKTVV